MSASETRYPQYFFLLQNVQTVVSASATIPIVHVALPATKTITQN